MIVGISPFVKLFFFPIPVEKLSATVSLSFQDWGRAGDVAALGVCWHVPSTEEEDFVFQLLSHLLHPELERIKDHVSGDQPMSRCAQFSIFRHNQAQTQHKDVHNLPLPIKKARMKRNV